MYTLKIKSLGVDVQLPSIASVKEYVYDLHNKYDLVSSVWDWDNSNLLKDGEKIGRVSYNGRVWDLEDNEILD